MKNNDYDFEMEWPEGYEDCADVPPATAAEMEGIMKAIQPAIRRLRMRHRRRMAVKGATAILSIGCCIFIGCMFFKNQHQAPPAVETAKVEKVSLPSPGPIETAVVSNQRPIKIHPRVTVKRPASAPQPEPKLAEVNVAYPGSHGNEVRLKTDLSVTGEAGVQYSHPVAPEDEAGTTEAYKDGHPR